MSWTRDRFGIRGIGIMTELRIVWVVVVTMVLLPNMSMSAAPAMKTVSIAEGFGAGAAVERVLVERCSLMGATDEIVNTWGQVRNVTVQWTIITEGRPPHSMGWLSGNGSDRVTIHHCLFAHNADRNPRLAGGVYDVVNNVIYNWSHHNAAKIGDGARVNFVNNAYVAGPQSTTTESCILPEDPDKGTQLYLAGNITPLTPTGTEDQWLSVTYW